MFVEAIVAGLIIGWSRKGRISNLTSMQFKGIMLIILGVVLHIAPVFLNRLGLFTDYLHVLPFSSMAVMVIALALNLDKKGVWLIGIGAVLNIIAMAVNGFVMPISMEALQIAGLEPLAETIKDGSVINLISSSEAASWSLPLTKFIPLPAFYPLSKVLSIGDLVATVGVIWMIQGVMRQSFFSQRGSMLKYSYKTRI